MKDRNIVLAAAVIVAAEVAIGVYVALLGSPTQTPITVSPQPSPRRPSSQPIASAEPGITDLPTFDAALMRATRRAVDAMRLRSDRPVYGVVADPTTQAASGKVVRLRHQAEAADLMESLRKGLAVTFGSGSEPLVFCRDGGRLSLLIEGGQVDRSFSARSIDAERAAKVIADFVLPAVPAIVRSFSSSHVERLGMVVTYHVRHDVVDFTVFTGETVTFVVDVEECIKFSAGAITDQQLMQGGETHIVSETSSKLVTPKPRPDLVHFRYP